MRLIDSHAHLDFDDFHDDLSSVMLRAKQSGVEKIINIGADLDRSRASVLLADNYSHIFATVGVHPDEAEQVDFETIHDELMTLAQSSEKVVGVGETGLDYYQPPASSLQPLVIPVRKPGTQNTGALDHSSRAGMTKETKDNQKRLFQIHIDVARHLSLPLVIHIRNGEDEEAVSMAYEILSNHQSSNNNQQRGVIHCFTLGPEWAKRFVELGFYIGFTGIITYKNAQEIRDAVAAISLGRILIETDCPFLAPQKYRGQRNEPSYVVEVAEKLAEIKSLPLAKIAEQTTINVEKLFDI
jgi:TatD DNase family protein